MNQSDKLAEQASKVLEAQANVRKALDTNVGGYYGPKKKKQNGK